jgi:hypothetical protein
MRLLRRFLMRLSNSAMRHRADERLREEIAEHLALQTEENLRAGMSSGEARRQAVLKLGAAEAIQENHHSEQSLPLIENALHDLRYAVRIDPATISTQVREQVQSVDAELPVFRAQTLDDVLSASPFNTAIFQWKWLHYLQPPHCCSRDSESMEPSPTW